MLLCFGAFVFDLLLGCWEGGQELEELPLFVVRGIVENLEDAMGFVSLRVRWNLLG